MAIENGGGRYEKECVEALEKTGAEFTLLIVGHMEEGKSGFSCAFTKEGFGRIKGVIKALRQAAQQFEDTFFPDPSTTQGRDATNESEQKQEGQ